MAPGQVRLTSIVDAAQRDTWHRGTVEVDGPDRSASSVLWVNDVRFGLGRSLEFDLRLPAAWMDARDGAESVERNSVGDLATLLTWTGAREDWMLAATAGVHWPTGDLASDGLPATATFSTGTIDYAAGVSVAGPRVAGWGWQVTTISRLVFDEQDDGRRLGSSSTTTFGVDRPVGSRWVGQLLLTHFHRQADDGPVMEDTGGDWIYLQPQIAADLFTRPDHAIQAVAGLRIPLRQDVRGTQLVDTTTFNVGLAYTWDGG